MLTDILKSCIEQNKTHMHIPNAIETDETQWDTFLKYSLYLERAGGPDAQHKEEFYVFNGVQKDDIYNLKNVEKFTVECYQAYDERIKNNHSFTIIVSKIIQGDPGVESSGVGRHADPNDSIHLSYIGKTIWYIYEDDQVKEYILNPGDVMYIRRGTEHGVSSLSQRAGIVFIPDNAGT